MFSQMCIKNSVHEGVHPPRQTPPGQTAPLGRQPQTPPLERHPPRQIPPGQTPTHPKTATAVDGTHPTGMHSCLARSEVLLYQLTIQLSVVFMAGGVSPVAF